MNVVQKIIKYLAIALAIFIIINIVSVVLSVLYGLSWISGATKDVEIIESQEEIYSTIGNTDITTLKIELNASNLEIKNGETTKDLKFSIECLRCVGACGLAPVVVIDGKVYSRVSPDDITDILNEYRELEVNC